jgi:2-phospho-L-lactate guanylyltransferase
MREPGWAVVVPVKRLAAAKTRLRGTAPGVPHARLVLAMAQDTVRAVHACPVVSELLVVTDDPEVTAALGALGASVVPDAPGAGLNASIRYGVAALAAGPEARWVAALAGDLPALRPDELAGALRAAAGTGARGFVPDHAGTGTTLLAAPPGAALEPRFGPGSAARHATSGAHRLAGAWPSLRRDVDTAADLAAAQRLGLGPHTAGCLRAGVASRACQQA